MLLSMTPIGNSTVFPASAVVQILTTFPNGQVEQGTGTMVNQNTVLTAGHMVYKYSDGGFAKSIEVIAGRNGNAAPFGVAHMKYEETFNSYIADSQRNSESHAPGDGDIGFISLDRNLGNSTGWLGFMATSGSSYNVNIWGYPGAGGYNGTQMYHYFGALNANGPGSASGFGYWGWPESLMSTVPGDSGSALVLDLNGKLGIIGVLETGNSSEGFAEVTNQTVLKELSKFEAAHPGPGVPGSPPPAPTSPSNPQPPSTPPAAPSPLDELAMDARLLVQSFESGNMAGVDAAIMGFESILFNSPGASPTALEQAFINDIFADL